MIEALKSYLPTIADIIGIIGVGFSVLVFFRAGSIKKSVENGFTLRKKMIDYEKIRKKSLREISECAAYFNRLENDITFRKAMPYISRLDQAIKDIKAYHPALTAEIQEAIAQVEIYIINSNESDLFSYLNIISEVHQLISMLKTEALYCD